MRTRSTLVFAALTLLLVGLSPTRAQAQTLRPVDLQLFRPAIDSKGYITLNASQVLGHLDVSFGLVVNYANSVLNMSNTLTTPENFADIETRFDVEHLITGHFQGAIGLFKHFELGVGLPLTLWLGDTNPDPGPGDDGGIDAQGLGDLSLHLKGRILNTSKHPVGLGMVASVYFPTGNEESFLGSGRFTIHPSVIVDKEFFRGRVSVAANIGARIRTGKDTWSDSRLCDDGGTDVECGTGKSITTNHHLTWGVGASFGVVPGRFSLLGEIIGQTGFDGFADPEAFNSAMELLLGMKLYLGRNSFFSLGVGRGLRGEGDNHQYGSPSVRVFGAFIFEPSIGDKDDDGLKDDVDKCPNNPEDFDDFEDLDGCPDPDNDRDGLPDEEDKCPNEPEDKDGIEDGDGCPELDVLDRDGDGIPDEKDSCPDDPEDKDKFQDKDGCPDPDNDQDKILDVDDLCPNKPEDVDTFEDKDGCPDPDNDKDRILDVDDACPNEPEVYNGHKDDDGCPDKSKVVVRKGRIEILDKIYFETDKATIKPVSFSLLDAVANTLKGNPQILQVEIQGHADERGSDDHNMKLTDDRANSVRQYLIDKGIDENRLTAKGYGETKPIDRRSTPEAWSKNRRVEFVILKRAE